MASRHKVLDCRPSLERLAQIDFGSLAEPRVLEQRALPLATTVIRTDFRPGFWGILQLR
jgi:hypothetical protein